MHINAPRSVTVDTCGFAVQSDERSEVHLNAPCSCWWLHCDRVVDRPEFNPRVKPDSALIWRVLLAAGLAWKTRSGCEVWTHSTGTRLHCCVFMCLSVSSASPPLSTLLCCRCVCLTDKHTCRESQQTGWSSKITQNQTMWHLPAGVVMFICASEGKCCETIIKWFIYLSPCFVLANTAHSLHLTSTSIGHRFFSLLSREEFDFLNAGCLQTHIYNFYMVNLLKQDCFSFWPQMWGLQTVGCIKHIAMHTHVLQWFSKNASET